MAESVQETISKAWDETQGPSDTPAADPAAAAPQEIDAPPDWAHEDREAFRQWQPDVRKSFMDKYTSFTKSAEEKYAEQVKAAQEFTPYREVISARQQMFQQRGIKPEQWFNNLAQLDDFATRDPKGFAKWYIQNTGLDPRELFGLQQQAQAAQDASGGYVDPEINQLRTTIQQLQQQIGQTQQGFQSYQQQLAAQQEQRRAQEIDQFRTAKGPDGKLSHPYFDEVQGVAINLLRAGVASDLNSAYEQAVYAHAPTRAKVLADQQAQQIRKAEDDKRKHSEKAQKAAVSVSTSGTGANGGMKPKKGESPMDTIRRAAADLEVRRH